MNIGIIENINALEPQCLCRCMTFRKPENLIVQGTGLYMIFPSQNIKTIKMLLTSI